MSGREGSRPDTDLYELERHSQTELNDAWQVVLSSNLPKGGTISVGRIELWPVEGVKELGSEVQAQPVFRTKPRVLEDPKVKVLYAVRAYVRLHP